MRSTVALRSLVALAAGFSIAMQGMAVATAAPAAPGPPSGLPVATIMLPASSASSMPIANGDRLFVPFYGGVSIVDLAENSVAGTVFTEGFPTILLSPDGSRLFVTSNDDHTIRVVDTDSREVVAKFQTRELIADAHQPMTVDADGRTLFILEKGLRSPLLIEAIDVSSGKSLRQVTLPEFEHLVASGLYFNIALGRLLLAPVLIADDEDERYVVVAVDPDTIQPIGMADTSGNTPVVDSQGRHLYIQTEDGLIDAINTSDLSSSRLNMPRGLRIRAISGDGSKLAAVPDPVDIVRKYRPNDPGANNEGDIVTLYPYYQILDIATRTWGPQTGTPLPPSFMVLGSNGSRAYLILEPSFDTTLLAVMNSAQSAPRAVRNLRVIRSGMGVTISFKRPVRARADGVLGYIATFVDSTGRRYRDPVTFTGTKVRIPVGTRDTYTVTVRPITTVGYGAPASRVHTIR